MTNRRIHIILLCITGIRLFIPFMEQSVRVNTNKYTHTHIYVYALRVKMYNLLYSSPTDFLRQEN